MTPTRHRIYVAFALASLLTAGGLQLLAMIIETSARDARAPGKDEPSLSVYIREQLSEPDTTSIANADEPQGPEAQDVSTDEVPIPEFEPSQAGQPAVAEAADPADEADDASEDTASVAAVDAYVDEAVDLYFKQQDARAAMWRRTDSVMHQPTSVFRPRESEPLLPDFRFKPGVDVVGLGFKLGSCFFGVPLAGIPVEERTAEITVIVCARDAS